MLLSMNLISLMRIQVRFVELYLWAGLAKIRVCLETFSRKVCGQLIGPILTGQIVNFHKT